jgi:hypothetical protein
MNMTDKETYGSLTDAELEAFDKASHEQFDRSLRISQALRQARKPPASEPQPGSEEAKEAIRDAIRQDSENKIG